jgi:hypothetical protein
VIAFLLDAKIRKATAGTKSLDDAMQVALQRYGGAKGYTPQQFYTVMSHPDRRHSGYRRRSTLAVGTTARRRRGAEGQHPPVARAVEGKRQKAKGKRQEAEGRRQKAKGKRQKVVVSRRHERGSLPTIRP